MATMKTLNGYGFNATELNGKAPEYYIQPRNLLDNSDFEIAQAGYGGYHGSTIYAADRWEQNDSTVRTYNYAARYGHGALECNDSTRIQQKLYLVNEQAYTGAFYINGKLYLHSFIANGGSYGGDKIWINYQSDGTYMFIIADIPAGGVVSEPVLYPGTYTADTLPLYVPKGYAAELAECQRYYYQSFSGSSAKGWDGMIVCEAITTSRATNVFFPQTMRIEKPTVTLYSPLSGNVGKTSEFVSDTEVDASPIYRLRYRFMLNSATSAFEIGKHYCIHYTVSADL